MKKDNWKNELTETKTWWGTKYNFEDLGKINSWTEYDKEKQVTLVYKKRCNVCMEDLRIGRYKRNLFYWCKRCFIIHFKDLEE